VPVGELHRQDAAGIETVQIELEGLFCRQMQRDRIAGIRINHQHVIAVRLCRKQRACIAKSDGDRSLAIRQIGELVRVLCDRHHLGVDLKEAIGVVGASPASHRAGTQADQADLHRRAVCVGRQSE